MTSSSFIVQDYYELLALHKALMEAQFCDDPNNFDISASPVIALLHKRLLESLVHADSARNGEAANNKWENWLSLSSDRREWNVALSRAQNERRWFQWTKEERLEYVKCLLAPFCTSDKLLEEFINQV